MQYPVKKADLPVPTGKLPAYLTEAQVNALTKAFQDWYDGSSKGRRRQRGRYWLTYLVLRFTGARLGEVLLPMICRVIDTKSGIFVSKETSLNASLFFINGRDSSSDQDQFPRDLVSLFLLKA